MLFHILYGRKIKVSRMDQYSSDTGNLNVIVTGTDSYSPLSSATIEIANTGEPNRILESVKLSAPPREYSMEPTDNQPYSEYNVKISAPGYQEGLVSGVQIFSGENGLQSIVLQPSEQTPDYVYNPIVIGGSTENRRAGDQAFIRKWRDRPLTRRRTRNDCRTRRCPRRLHCYRLLCPIHRLHQKCRLLRDLLHLARKHDRSQYSGNHVLHFKPGIYRMVPKQRL